MVVPRLHLVNAAHRLCYFSRRSQGFPIFTPIATRRLYTVLRETPNLAPMRDSVQPERYSSAASGTSSGRRTDAKVSTPRAWRYRLTVVRCTSKRTANSRTVAPDRCAATSSSTSSALSVRRVRYLTGDGGWSRTRSLDHPAATSSSRRTCADGLENASMTPTVDIRRKPRSGPCSYLV
jgi:hypothetical protein